MPTPQADGPDTSHWQTFTGAPMPWPLHALKCSEGRQSGDSTFPARWRMLRDTGVKYRGAYHWLRSDSPATDQANNLIGRLNLLGGLRRGEFIQLDWETTPNIPNLTISQVNGFIDHIQGHYGRACVIVYGSDWVPGFTAWRDANPDFPLWYANYNTSDKSTGGWAECSKFGADVWQWTSSYQHPSVAGGFDMNHVFRWDTLDRLTDQTVASDPPAPTPGEWHMIPDTGVLFDSACSTGRDYELDLGWARTAAFVRFEIVTPTRAGHITANGHSTQAVVNYTTAGGSELACVACPDGKASFRLGGPAAHTARVRVTLQGRW